MHVNRETWSPSKRQAADAARGSAWSLGSCLDYKNASRATSQDVQQTERKTLRADRTAAARPLARGAVSLSLSLPRSLIVNFTPRSPHLPLKLFKHPTLVMHSTNHASDVLSSSEYFIRFHCAEGSFTLSSFTHPRLALNPSGLLLSVKHKSRKSQVCSGFNAFVMNRGRSFKNENSMKAPL